MFRRNVLKCHCNLYFIEDVDDIANFVEKSLHRRGISSLLWSLHDAVARSKIANIFFICKVSNSGLKQTPKLGFSFSVVRSPKLLCAVALSALLLEMSRSTKLAIASVTTAALSYVAYERWKTSQQKVLELCQVQVVFRHGARTPLHVASYMPAVAYDTDLLKHPLKTFVPFHLTSMTGEKLSESPFEKSYHKRGHLKGGCWPGQLTNVGAGQMYDLGLFLKKRYVDDGFLNPMQQMRVSEIYTRSTNIQRTIESARCVLAGLFSDGKFDADFPICVCTPNKEIMYPNYYSCAQLATLTRWVWLDPDKLPGIKPIREAVQRDLNIADSEKLDLVSLRDNLAAEAAHGKESLPMSEHTRRVTEDAALEIMKGAFVGIEPIRASSLLLASGAFVDLLMSNMEAKAKGDDGAKMRLYSGHDTTLIPLLSALGVSFSEWPKYAAHVILELFRETTGSGVGEKYYVRLLYNGEEQQIGDCKSPLCPLEEFTKAVSQFRISEDRFWQKCTLEVEKDMQAAIEKF